MELETKRFYAARCAALRRCRHAAAARRSRRGGAAPRARGGAVHRRKPAGRRARRRRTRPARRLFVLQVIQPGLAGLMDGSVSTLAPLFAAAFATRSSWDAFLVGLAASIGAGISMGFAEALSDDGSLTGRGQPWLRGVVCGLMTDARRPRPHAALPDPQFPCRDHGRGGGGRGRARTDRLDPQPLHGHAVALGGFPGRGRRRPGVPHRHPDRQRVSQGLRAGFGSTTGDGSSRCPAHHRVAIVAPAHGGDFPSISEGLGFVWFSSDIEALAVRRSVL